MSNTRNEWTESELEVIVKDYFAMLIDELNNRDYSKADHRRSLSELLNDRSKGSIEFKHQNISAVMIDLGMPYIDGYKPLFNYQSSLYDFVENYLQSLKMAEWEMIDNSTILQSRDDVQLTTSFQENIFEPPPDDLLSTQQKSKPWAARKGIKRDYILRDYMNQKLGNKGEEFVYQHELHRLQAMGLDKVKDKVVWASNEYGDGLGYDIISYDIDLKSEIFIEVKTTSLGKHFPFYVTKNEVECSKSILEKYFLYRLFHFNTIPRCYRVNGAIHDKFSLEPTCYLASFNKQ